jgi:peptidoglycan/LPS O-acetylase OafA/YrhL
MRYCLRMQPVLCGHRSAGPSHRQAGTPVGGLIPPYARQRTAELDGMRGIAILLVLMRHYIHHPSLILFGPQWGWMGVNLFFVLSGYLITQILLRLRKAQAALGIFYARRSLRIFPLYYTVLAVYFSAAFFAGHPQPVKTVLLYVTFLHAFLPPILTHPVIVPHPAWAAIGLAVLWSLSVEEYFYLLWAPVVAWTNAHRATLYSICGLLLLGIPWIRFYYPDPKGGQELFIAQADSLAAGCMVALLADQFGPRLLAWIRQRTGIFYIQTVALIGVAIWIDFATGITKRSLYALRVFNATEYSVLWLAWSIGLFAVLAIAGTAAPLARVLRWRWLCFLGRISYCLYLVHYPIYILLRQHMQHSLALVAGLGLSIAVAALSWRFFEGPIARWKQERFRYAMPQDPEAPLATELAGTPYS